MTYRATSKGRQPLRPVDIAQQEADRAALPTEEAKRAARAEFRSASVIPPSVLAAMIGPSSPQDAQDWKARFMAAKAALKG